MTRIIIPRCELCMNFSVTDGNASQLPSDHYWPLIPRINPLPQNQTLHQQMTSQIWSPQQTLCKLQDKNMMHIHIQGPATAAEFEQEQLYSLGGLAANEKRSEGFMQAERRARECK